MAVALYVFQRGGDIRGAQRKMPLIPGRRLGLLFRRGFVRQQKLRGKSHRDGE